MKGTYLRQLRARVSGTIVRFSLWLSGEVTGGVILLGAALLGLMLANSPLGPAYEALGAFTVGPRAWDLHIPISAWASDGLLALFFFVIGLELKQELTTGTLRNPAHAAVPVLGAVGGMIVPAAVFIWVVHSGDPGAVHGWAIPTATDIAFALAVLGIFGRGLPTALRTFLLTLAVMDDLLAIIVIAVFYSGSLSILPLVGALLSIAAFALVARMKKVLWYLLIPLSVLAWILMHSSGVHATIAGVLMGLTVPASSLNSGTGSRAKQMESAIRPISNGIALPIFAFFAAGVPLIGNESGSSLSTPVFWGVLLGLVVGKVVGVLLVSTLVTKLTPFRLPDAIGIRDLLPVGLLTGIGFTVSLLIAELAFTDSLHISSAKLAVLSGSLISGTLGAIMLRWDAKKSRSADMNLDGVPDTDTTPLK